jgi:hypothetical protein
MEGSNKSMSDSAATMSSRVSDPKIKSTQAVLPPQRTESRQSIQQPAPAAALVEYEPTPEEVAALAYQLWIERGSPHGSDEEDWYRAEEQLRTAEPLKRSATAS